MLADGGSGLAGKSHYLTAATRLQASVRPFTQVQTSYTGSRHETQRINRDLNGIGSGYRITMTDHDLERELPPAGGYNSHGSLIIGQGLPGSAHISVNESSQFHV